MTVTQNVAEFHRLLFQLQVKAMLYVENGADAGQKESRASALNEALSRFIAENLNYYRSEPQCGDGCHWSDNLQMCVCDGMFTT
jgi:hypothetical protein